MKKLSKRTFAFFAFAYLVTLLVTAPASLLDNYLQHVSQGRMIMANTSGTIWNGSATPALRQQENRFIGLPPLRWDIAVLPLFTGIIKARLQWSDQPLAPAMDAIISPSRFELHHALIRLPALALSGVSPILKPARFGGQFQIQSEQLIFSKRGIDGSAVADWQQASSALSSIAPLGNYRLALSGAGDRINIGLTTVSGILLLEGKGNWLAGRGLEFHGRAQASAGNHDNLTELLHHLGPEESPGVHGFNITPQ